MSKQSLIEKSMKITALVPCRAGSERVKHKNIRPFCGTSLLEIKLDQLLKAKNITEIILSTDDLQVIKIWEQKYQQTVTLHHREAFFASSSCSTDQLIKYFADCLSFEHLLWTHVTSPFVDALAYDLATEKYISGFSMGYDSLLSAQGCSEFIWDKAMNPQNYQIGTQGKWPRTQDISPFYIIDSAMFFISKVDMLKYQNRVGKNPSYYSLDQVQTIDIDWEKDFILAEKLWSALHQN